jgi:hypothetical protein
MPHRLFLLGARTLLVSFAMSQAPLRPPDLNDQVVRWTADASEDDFIHGDPERYGAISTTGQFDSEARELGVSGPRAGVVYWRILTVAVERNPRIPTQVVGAPRASHYSQNDLTAGEVHLGSADPGRTVAPKSGHRMVLVPFKQVADPRGEFRLCVFELTPAHLLEMT